MVQRMRLQSKMGTAAVPVPAATQSGSSLFGTHLMHLCMDSSLPVLLKWVPKLKGFGC